MRKIGLFLSFLISTAVQAQILPKTFSELAAAINSGNQKVVMGELENGLEGIHVAISDLSKAGVTARGILCWGEDYTDLSLPGFGRDAADESEIYPWSARVVKMMILPKVMSEAKLLYGSNTPWEAFADLEKKLNQDYYVGCEINLVDTYSSTGSFGGGTLLFVIDTEGEYGVYLGSYWFE